MTYDYLEFPSNGKEMYTIAFTRTVDGIKVQMDDSDAYHGWTLTPAQMERLYKWYKAKSTADVDELIEGRKRLYRDSIYWGVDDQGEVYRKVEVAE